jgi:hypothetical protein
MTGRRSTKRARRSAANGAIPPAPGAEWADPDEFTAFWGKSIDEIADECEEEHAQQHGEREIFHSDEEFLAALRREMKRPPQG